MENDVENPQNGWGTSGFSPECSKKGSSISMYGVNRSFVDRRNIFKLLNNFCATRKREHVRTVPMVCIQ